MCKLYRDGQESQSCPSALGQYNWICFPCPTGVGKSPKCECSVSAGVVLGQALAWHSTQCVLEFTLQSVHSLCLCCGAAFPWVSASADLSALLHCTGWVFRLFTNTFQVQSAAVQVLSGIISNLLGKQIGDVNTAEMRRPKAWNQTTGTTTYVSLYCSLGACSGTANEKNMDV